MKFGKCQHKKETDPERMTKEELIEYMLKKKAALKSMELTGLYDSNVQTDQFNSQL